MANMLSLPTLKVGELCLRYTNQDSEPYERVLFLPRRPIWQTLDGA